jgi:hypothetical protein
VPLGHYAGPWEKEPVSAVLVGSADVVLTYIGAGARISCLLSLACRD